MKCAHYSKSMLRKQDCVKFRGRIAWQNFFRKQLCLFLQCSAGKKKNKKQIKISSSRWWRFQLATSPIFLKLFVYLFSAPEKLVGEHFTKWSPIRWRFRNCSWQFTCQNIKTLDTWHARWLFVVQCDVWFSIKQRIHFVNKMGHLIHPTLPTGHFHMQSLHPLW